MLIQLVDLEKRFPGILVEMIADNLQERWVVGYGRPSAADERAPDSEIMYEIASITKLFSGILLARTSL